MEKEQKQARNSKAFLDSIPAIEGREFQYELPLPGEEPADFMTPIATGASVLHVHTSQLHPDRQTFPRLFRRMVDSTGETQAEICKRGVGEARQSLHQYLTGRRSNPSLQFFLRVAAACGCRVLIEYPRRVK